MPKLMLLLSGLLVPLAPIYLVIGRLENSALAPGSSATATTDQPGSALPPA